jgi:RND family efflux transporter MFP subunit
MKRFGIEVGTVGPGTFEVHISVPGEITFNESTLAHIVPGISGIVREVDGDIGDAVTAGEAIAWLESTELGGAKVKYLSRLSELSCCAIELVRAQEIHDNTLKLLETLKISPSLEDLRSLNGSGMGMNRSLLVSSYAEFTFARDAYLREKDLFEKKISSKEDFLKAESAFKKADAKYVATQDSVNFDINRNLLEAKQAQDVQEIELKAAERLLYVLGLNTEDINDLKALSTNKPSQSNQEEQCSDPNCTECALEGAAGSSDINVTNEKLAWYPIRAAFDGTIINRHITLGEFVSNASEIFVVADLTKVWLDLQIHQKDVAHVSKGQEVIISGKSGVSESKGVIDRVYPVIDGSSRTTVARVILDNTAGQFRPGMFVSADVQVEKHTAEVVVAKDSLQNVDDQTCVFVKDDHGFELRQVELGLSNDEFVEVVFGLESGEMIVTRNSFRLKAELEKAGGAHAGHGHAH